MASDNSERLKKIIISENLFGPMDSGLLEDLVNLCQFHNKTPEDLFYIWESTKPIGSQSIVLSAGFDSTGLESLRAALHSKKKQRNTITKFSKKPGRGLAIQTRPSASSEMYFGRVKKVKTERNEAPLTTAQIHAPSTSKVQFKELSSDERSLQPRRVRYMYEKINERSEALDGRIDQFAVLVKDYYQVSDLGDPTVITEEEVTVVGRIAMDSDTSSAPNVKLNEASMVLESSRSMGSGVRVPLKFDTNIRVRHGRPGSGGFGLFPGAIVALRGRNGGGGWFLVSELLTLPPLQSPLPSAGAQLGEPFSMYIASGPFTSDNDLLFKPFKSFLQRLESESPDVLLLIGPFLDCLHPHIKQGRLDVPPSAFFRDVFVAPLQSFLDNTPGSMVVLVPSVQDLLSEHCVFPQCGLKSNLVNDPRIKLLPNPSKFSLNNVTIAVSSVDVLFHLRKDEMFKSASVISPKETRGLQEGELDSMGRLCEHLLNQRSLYPIFPTSLNVCHEINLDITHSSELEIWDDELQGPELLILPSRLKSFSKSVNYTSIINPSFLSKGTFAQVTYTQKQKGVLRNIIEIMKI